MILADKIIKLRRASGMSQEELAEKMKVSRQAVSKWEAAQSTPDLEKLLQLSRLFGVTVDYLIKDEIEQEESDGSDGVTSRRLTIAQANEYMELRRTASLYIAAAVALCILSAIPLLMLIALSSFTSFPIATNTAVGIGVVSIFPFVAVAVLIFIRVSIASSGYEFLEKEFFEPEYGVVGLVKERQKEFRPKYAKYNSIGAVVCIGSPIPVLCGAFMNNGFLLFVMICATLLAVAIGVSFFIVAGVRWESMNRLLCEGEFTECNKRKNKKVEAVETAFWLFTTAVYLLWSFLADAWNISWVVWPVAGILSGVIERIAHVCTNDTDKDE